MEVKCCGKEMGKNLETTGYIEMQCSNCGDVIYVKKDKTSTQKPVMLDD